MKWTSRVADNSTSAVLLLGGLCSVLRVVDVSTRVLMWVRGSCSFSFVNQEHVHAISRPCYVLWCGLFAVFFPAVTNSGH